jgi:hypothetical protein
MVPLHGYPGRDVKKQAAIEHPHSISSPLAETIQISRKIKHERAKVCASIFRNGTVPAAESRGLWKPARKILHENLIADQAVKEIARTFAPGASDMDQRFQ